MEGVEIIVGAYLSGKVEQVQPVQQGVLADRSAAPGGGVMSAWKVSVQAIEAPGVEPQDQHLSFGFQHPFYLAQELVLVENIFECMGQDQDVDAF